MLSSMSGVGLNSSFELGRAVVFFARELAKNLSATVALVKPIVSGSDS